MIDRSKAPNVTPAKPKGQKGADAPKPQGTCLQPDSMPAAPPGRDRSWTLEQEKMGEKLSSYPSANRNASLRSLKVAHSISV